MNRKRLTKAERQQVYEKYDGRCAYCGKEIEFKDMQVDHLVSLHNGGADSMDNYMPACRMCNHYKRTASLETFRKLISEIPHKLKRDSYIYRVGVAYGIIEPREDPKIRFHFEVMDMFKCLDNEQTLRTCHEKPCAMGFPICCFDCEAFQGCPEACTNEKCAGEDEE